MNKCDKTQAFSNLPVVRKNRIFMAAGTGIGIDALLDLIEQSLFGGELEKTFLIPYADGGAEHLLRTQAGILSCDYREDGILIRCMLPARLYGKIKAYEQKYMPTFTV